MPALKSEEVVELMTRSGERQRIRSVEIVAILKKYEVAGDAEALQDSYRKGWGSVLWRQSGTRQAAGRFLQQAGIMLLWIAVMTLRN